MLIAGVHYPEHGQIAVRVVDPLPAGCVVQFKTPIPGLPEVDSVDPPTSGEIAGPLFVLSKAFNPPRKSVGPAPKGTISEWARIPLPFGASAAPEGVAYFDPDPGMALWLHRGGIPHWCAPVDGSAYCVGRVTAVLRDNYGRISEVEGLIWPPRYLIGATTPPLPPSPQEP